MMKISLWTVGICLVLIFVLSGCNGDGNLPSGTQVSEQIPTSTQTPVVDQKTPTATPTALVVSSTAKNDTANISVQATPTNIPNSQVAPTEEVSNPFLPTASLPATLPPQPDCTDVVSFVDDITIPDGTLLKPGIEFEKIWRVKNEGTCVWSGYQLVYAGGEPMSGMVTTVQTVNPDETVNISIKLKAPIRGGKQVGNWMFLTPWGKVFGVGVPNNGTLWVDIQVDYPVSTASPDNGGTGSTSSSGSGSLGDCQYTTDDSYIQQILSLINAEREKNGLDPLSLDNQLTSAAQGHSVDMACHANISHNGSDGLLWYDRVKAQGFANYVTARENIYAGNPDFGGDAAGAFSWWMNSSIHRANILFANVTRIGIGYAYNAAIEIKGYYTMVVARP